MQIANGLPNGDVTIETTDDEQSTLSCQKAYFKIHGLAAENFQKPEEVQEEWTLKLPVQDLVKNLIKVSYAKSMDEDGRRYLNGVLLSVRGDVLTIAATDGRRLALVEKPLEAGTAVDGDIILPAKASVELTRSLDGVGEVTIRVSQSTIVFETADVVLTSKLIEGTYPNYRQVIPKTFAKNVAIPRAAFSEALARVSMVVSDSSTSVRLSLGENTLTISANSNEVGESSEPVEIEYTDEPFEISFNPQFVSEPLKYLDCEQLIMQFSDDLSPVALTGDEGFLYIIMPMRG
jgi:DNA polymerase-3 subunit beta